MDTPELDTSPLEQPPTTVVASSQQPNLAKSATDAYVGPAFAWPRTTSGIRSIQLKQWLLLGAKRLPQLLAGLGGQQFLGAVIQGALVGIGFLITGLPSALMFGAIAALLALLPVGGTALIWLPGVVVLASQDRWGMAFVMLAIGIMSSSIENVLRPLLISGRAHVSTLTVFICVLGGTAAFGPIGLFAGPVFLAVSKINADWPRAQLA